MKPPATTLPLYEFVHGDGKQRAYSVDPKWTVWIPSPESDVTSDVAAATVVPLPGAFSDLPRPDRTAPRRRCFNDWSAT